MESEYCLNNLTHAPVAQLDRASDFGSEGWGFESLQACYIFRKLIIFFTLVSKDTSLRLIL